MLFGLFLVSLHGDKYQCYSKTVGFSSVLYYSVDPMRPTLENSFNTMKIFLSLQPMFPPKPFDIFSFEIGCSEGLDAFRFFFLILL